MGVKETVNDVAEKTAKIAGDLIDSTKNKTKLLGEKARLKEAYIALGKYCYQHYNPDTAEDALKPLIADVTKSRAIIQALEKEIAKACGEVICASCGHKTKNTSVFCPKCGEKLG